MNSTHRVALLWGILLVQSVFTAAMMIDKQFIFALGINMTGSATILAIVLYSRRS